MSIPVAQNDFTRKMIDFDTFTNVGKPRLARAHDTKSGGWTIVYPKILTITS